MDTRKTKCIELPITRISLEELENKLSEPEISARLQEIMQDDVIKNYTEELQLHVDFLNSYLKIEGSEGYFQVGSARINIMINSLKAAISKLVNTEEYDLKKAILSELTPRNAIQILVDITFNIGYYAGLISKMTAKIGKKETERLLNMYGHDQFPIIAKIILEENMSLFPDFSSRHDN